MLPFIVNLLISASVISLVTWISRLNTQLAGFIIALPISTMLVLALSHAEYQDHAASIRLAKSIFSAIPMSLLFFVPFLLAERLAWPFWVQYSSGVVLLGIGYIVHRIVAPLL